MTDDLLREIINQLEILNARQAPRQLSHQDHNTLGRLLPALGGAFGPSSFSVRQLLADPVFRELLGDRNAKQAGNLLSRAVDHDIDGLRVKRVTSEHGSMLWQVVR